MYYIIYIALYLVLVLLFVALIKKPVKEESKRFNDILMAEAVKGLTKRDAKYRKRRISILPLHQRFLYRCWFYLIIMLIVVFPLMFCLIRWLLIRSFVVPDNAMYYELSELSTLFFAIGGFFLGIPLLIAFSYATNRGVIRKADRLYRLGSFQEYPKKANIFISGILGLLGLLIMLLPCNCYRYCTNKAITVKSTFSLVEKEYAFSDISHVEKAIYYNGRNRKYDQNYTFYTTDGKHFHFGENVYDEQMNEILKKKGIEVRVIS